MRNFHLGVTVCCFGYILSLNASGMRGFDHFDLRPSHINSCQTAISQAYHKVDALSGCDKAIILTPPVFFAFPLTSHDAETGCAVFQFIRQFPSRASPA